MDKSVMRKLLLALAFLLAPSFAWAQCNGVFPANSVCGSVIGGVPGPISAGGFVGSITVGGTAISGGTNTRVLYDNAGILGEYTNVQLTALCQAFSSVLSGCAPASGGGTANFLRADGTWAAPPGATSGTVTSVTIAAGTGISVGGTCVITSSGTCTVTNTGVTSVTCNGGLTGGAITTTGTCAVDIATNTNIWAGTANKIVDAAGNVSSQVPQSITISTATFTPNFSNGINFDVILVHASCPCTIANPTSIHQNTYFLTIVQSGTGSDTIGTWDTFYKFPGGVKPTLSTAAGAVDIVPITCRNTPGGAATINFCMVGPVTLAYQ